MYKYNSQGIIKPIIYNPIKHILNFIYSKKYRSYSFLESKIRKIKRFNDFNTKISKFNIYAPDSWSFLSSYKEIFVNEIYNFKTNKDSPFIIDIGANIGLSILFFKTIYPNSKILAFEADPYIFKFLQKNIYGNGFNDVKLINKAAWIKDTLLKFSSDKADGGKVSNKEANNLIEIEAIDISKFFNVQEIDFLKIDIEGAEEFVLPHCKQYLDKVQNLFVEYHSSINQKQFLAHIINILSDSGFRIHIQTIHSSESPFIHLDLNNEFDLQLNIFGIR